MLFPKRSITIRTVAMFSLLFLIAIDSFAEGTPSQQGRDNALVPSRLLVMPTADALGKNRGVVLGVSAGNRSLETWLGLAGWAELKIETPIFTEFQTHLRVTRRIIFPCLRSSGNCVSSPRGSISLLLPSRLHSYGHTYKSKSIGGADKRVRPSPKPIGSPAWPIAGTVLTAAVGGTLGFLLMMNTPSEVLGAVIGAPIGGFTGYHLGQRARQRDSAGRISRAVIITEGTALATFGAVIWYLENCGKYGFVLGHCPG